MAVTLALPIAPRVKRTAAPAPSAGARSAFVRVDQVGYPTGGPKRAYLMSTGPETGATFQVRDGRGHVAYVGSVGPSLGAWSDAFPFVYPIDFDAVATPGTYRIVVTAPIKASSPRFPIDVGASLDRNALANALAFYRVQRDGPDFIRSALRRAPAHLNDRAAMTYRTPRVDADGVVRGDLHPLGVRIDASGGWWDAGDYLKFVHTTSYTVDLMLAGIRDFPDLMGSGSPTSDFTAEARFGLRWLLRMWDDRRQVLYYQVGIGSGNARTAGDHDLWRLPQADDTFGGRDPRYRYIRHRPVFRAGPPGSLVSPNLAGRDAAAFALCFQVFRERAPSFADRCLLAAEHVFDLADTNPAGRLVTAIPWDFYPEVEWRDDLELGATELFFAVSSGGLPPELPHTDPLSYLRAGAHWAREYVSGPNDAADTLNLYDVSGLAHYELARAIAQAGFPDGLAIDRAGLLADLKRQLDAAMSVAGHDPFGFGYPWNRWDTTTHGTGLSVMASEYDELTGTATFSAQSAGWLGNVLGANAWGASFIVGDGTTFPRCLHHQVANLAGALDGSAPVLLGAAVEGPNHFAAHGRLESMRRCPPGGGDRFERFNSRAVFKDDVEAYSTVEPAIDLTASGLLAFARQASGLY